MVSMTKLGTKFIFVSLFSTYFSVNLVALTVVIMNAKIMFFFLNKKKLKFRNNWLICKKDEYSTVNQVIN